MKITIFSSNQPRHINLVKELSLIADEVFFISEANTVFPGEIDDFYKKSNIMQSYFKNVISAEKKLFGDIEFISNNIRSLFIKEGDLSKINQEILKDALTSDFYIVFGASFIKGWLIDFLIKNQAVNIHMGISPYYRGSSCNFWALYDNKPGYVGATIHLLSKGLDNGDILFHCIPKVISGESPFEFTMRAVEVAQKGLIKLIKNSKIKIIERIKQDKNLEIRYTKNKDFTDETAQEFLQRDLQISQDLISYPKLFNPIFE